MFKWLKKVMISIINAINSLFVGNKQVISVSVGDTQVYPNGIVTYQMAGAPSLEYSSGQGYISASGSDYARIIGTLITNIDGVEQSRTTVEFTPTLLTSGVSNIWSVSDNHILAACRENVEGAARSATFQAVYSNSDGFVYNGGSFTVSQEANVRSVTKGAITSFKINGESTIIVIGSEAQTLSISSLSGYENVSYTSGPAWDTTISIPSYTYSNGGQDFVTINFNGNSVLNLSVAANTVGGSDREATITVRDAQFTSVSAFVIIRQETPWTLSATTSTNIGATATSFYVNVTSLSGTTPYPITSSMVTIPTNNSSVSLSSISDQGSGVYRLNFTCAVNNDTSNIKNNIIRITRDDHPNSPVTAQVVQAANQTALEGLSIVDIADNNTHWVLATYTSGRVDIPDSHGMNRNYGITGIIIACDSPITSEKTIRFDSLAIQRIITSGPTNSVYNVPQYTTQIISSGSTVSVGGGKSYYGAWLYIPNITWGSDGWVSGSGTTFTPAPTTSVNTASITVL